MQIAAIARERRHTLFFLDEIRPFAPVHLDTEVDMSGVLAHREAHRGDSRLSVVTYVLHSAARVIAAHPEANAAVRGRRRPKVARFGEVSGKIALDKRVGGRRVVVSAVLPDLAKADLKHIQHELDRYRDGDPETMPEFASMRLLHRLPTALARAAYRRAVRPLVAHSRFFGTFAVSSLGHRAVDGFHSVGGTTLTFGVGRILERPVVRDGEVTRAPVMRLNLTFDHRVVDGAEAADVLTEVKEALEGYSAEEGLR
ncbi:MULTISPECIES: 2-oxo acid dehydrogenase subunit E2 [unclassified Streptomyces]|uniref:2-oxo acid dehydrogenase subunit E2 n=1 Tax=unclassified Streptomyces TaxID=2593676 RepID=UPI00036285A9|nr:2-oxo acid dehydrogenase subunit E2 [Streptomyces sp. LaPpAH-202]MYW58241.1 acyltransferase [Streptomyces sp. SID8370]MYW86652.1 acyltransferase [Streptomyces sp. SID8371]